VEGGQEVGGGEVLGGKETVDCLKGELTAAVEEVGEVRLPEAGLAGQQGDAQSAPLNPAQQFQAEFLVHLRKIHLWKFRHEKWVR
jgi:hypothetical protein